MFLDKNAKLAGITGEKQREKFQDDTRNKGMEDN